MVRLNTLAALIAVALPLLLLVSACAPAATPALSSLPSPTPTASPSTPTATSLPPTPLPTPTPTPQAGLSGRILDNETGAPIAEAAVSAGDQTTTTNTQGEYALVGLPPGQAVLSVTYGDYDPGLSPIIALTAGAPQTLDLTLYPTNTSPYPTEPMLTNPLDPNGAPTPEEAERLARLQGLTGEVVSIEETKLRGEWLVNYKSGDEVRAAVAALRHEAWKLTDVAGQVWFILKVCGNLATRLPQEVTIPTPEPQPQPLLAEVLVDELTVYTCASEECDAGATMPLVTQVEVVGCLADGGWCQVSWDGVVGWCRGDALRQLAVAEAVPVVESVGPTAVPAPTGELKIAFLSTRNFPSQSSAPNELYLMNADGSQQVQVTSSMRLLIPCSLFWLPDFSQLIYETCGASLQMIDISTGAVTPWQVLGSSHRVSPDGNRLAYVHREANMWDIFVASRDGTGRQQLTTSAKNDLASQPSWSPDGSKLAFGLQSGGATHSLWVINSDGSEKVKLADVFARQSSWSPDGSRIAFECGIPGITQYPAQDICVINSDGSNLVKVTPSKGQQIASHPTWSPDGTKIAFYIQENANATAAKQVYVINADGTNLTQLTFEGDNCCPVWTR